MSATGPKQAETAVLGEGQSIYRRKRVDPGQGGWQRFQESEVTWTEGTWTWVETGGAVLGEGRRFYRRSESDPGQGGSGFRKARSRGHGYVDTGETGGLSWVRGGGSIEEVGVTQDRGGGVKK